MARGGRVGLRGFGAGKIGANGAAIGEDQSRNPRPLGKANPFVRAGESNQGAADLGAGGVAARVQNAGQGMRALARAQVGLAARAQSVRVEPFEAVGTVEVRAPLDELGHAQRAFGDQRLGRGTIDQAVAGVHGVFKVQRDVLVALHGHGDAALRVVRVRFRERFLRDDQNFAVCGELDGRAQAGHARAHH